MKLKCPYCGYDGSTEPAQHAEPFRYLEDIVCWREAVLDDAAALTVQSRYQTGEGYDDGASPRIECGNCLAEFPLPAEADIKWW